MYKKILVGTDFTPQADIARMQAVHLATVLRANLTIVHTLEIADSLSNPDAFSPSIANFAIEHAQKEEIHARTRLHELCSQSATESISVTERVIRGDAKQILCEIAKNESMDLVVVGTHGRTGYQRLRMGSVAESVVQHSHKSVMVARQPVHDHPNYQRILVPTDFSKSATNALLLATDLVAHDGTIEVLHLWQNPFATHSQYGGWAHSDDYYETVQTCVENSGNSLRQRIHKQNPSVDIVFRHQENSPTEGILGALDLKVFDLVIMGNQGRNAVARLFMGSVARNIVRHAPCSVVVVR